MIESLLQEGLSTELGDHLVLKEEASPVAESVRHASLLPTLGKDLQDLSLFALIEQSSQGRPNNYYCNIIIQTWIDCYPHTRCVE